MNLPLLKKEKVFGKTVFLRVDLDVPLAKFEIRNSPQSNAAGTFDVPKFEIEDETRLLAWMPTLQFLLNNKTKVIVAGHLGRPTSKNQEFSLLPVAKWFASNPLINNSSFLIQNTKIGEFDGWEITPKLFLLENLRFYKGEEENPTTASGQVFAKKLAELSDIYVNDAFATCHRNHASIVGVPRHLPHFAGLRLQKEVEVLGSVLENPVRPLVVVIGGAKIETKLSLVEAMYKLADYILVGGKIARESETLSRIRVDNPRAKQATLMIADLNADKTDITQRSLAKFLEVIKNAKTVVWNGPVGLINSKLEDGGTEKGTVGLAGGIAKSGAYTIVGGGDTVSFLRNNHLIDKFSFVSAGGGAMLAFLSKESMPGLKALISPQIN